MTIAATKKKISKKIKPVIQQVPTMEDVNNIFHDYSNYAQRIYNKFKNGKITKETKDYLKSVDYETLIKESLKVIVPLLAIRFISTRGQPSSRREEILDRLFTEAKSSLKKKKVI